MRSQHNTAALFECATIWLNGLILRGALVRRSRHKLSKMLDDVTSARVSDLILGVITHAFGT